MSSQSFDLEDAGVFHTWVEIFDRVQRGEMPPEGKKAPDPSVLPRALETLRVALHEHDAEQQRKEGRVPLRRLTRREYEHTLHDLLGIGGDLVRHLAPENHQARYDTIASEQGISPIHLQGYLKAADAAFDEAIQLGRRPRQHPVLVDYQNHPYTEMWFHREVRRGGSTIKKIEGAVVTFDSRPHPLRTDATGYRPEYPGLYRVRLRAHAYQATTPVTLQLFRSSAQRGGAQLIAFFDLAPGKPRTVSVTTYLTPEDYLYPAPAHHDADSTGRDVLAFRGWPGYQGEGLAIERMTIQGPLTSSWPPTSTTELLQGLEIAPREAIAKERRPSPPRGARRFELRLSKAPLDHVREILERLAPRIFRRTPEDGEVAPFVELARPSLEAGLGFEHGLRVSLRAILCSPQFLYQRSSPGPLDDFALASRLSYFLWKSLPDDELFRLARERKLQDPKTLAVQVDRLLDDERSMRFVRDFLGQWLGLDRIDETTPDDRLYPEYEDVLRQSMLRESEWFFRSLIARDEPVRDLVDARYAYLNRRLAEHYGIGGVPDERLRRVELAADSVRGGILTQASVLKITANGTVTSPVKRGTFVLSNLLGQNPGSPPADAGAIEPDTRGSTTIRETLAAHRREKTCASCHRRIDPPGFALESFDPIGGHRERYRSTGIGEKPIRRLNGRRIRDYRLGPRVDASGVTEDGTRFAGVRDLKRYLSSRERELAHNLLSQLAVYATGGEIRFSDRRTLDELAERSRKQGFGVRSMIQLIVASDLFRSK